MGSKYYFTGDPCKHGHISHRQTSNQGCMECVKISRTSKREKHNEQKRAYVRREVAKDSDFHKKVRAKRNKEMTAAQPWRQKPENLAKRQQLLARYRENNKEKISAANRRYAKENPLKIRAKVNRRRARLAEAEGFYTEHDVKEIIRLQKGKCAYCRESLGEMYHMDHIMPLVKGGSNWPANLQALCPSCNCKKHAADPIEYAQSLGLLI